MKKTYLLVLLNALFINLNAQSFQWAKREGLYAYDYGYGIAVDNAGNTIVAGKYEEEAIFSGTTLTNAGNHDIYLASYSPSGTLNWVKTAGGVLGDYAHAMSTDGANYIYIAGEIEGAGDVVSFEGSTTTLVTQGDNDIVVAKYDMSGNLIWAKSEGYWYSEKALGCANDNSGNVYICGYFSDNTIFNGVGITGTGSRDAFLAKYDANGNFQWVKVAQGPGREEGLDVKCDAAGNVYMCGMYTDGAVFGTTTLSSPLTYYNNYLAKYAPDGTLLWVKTSGSDYDEVAWSLAIDNAGKIYMAGEFNAYALFDSYALTTTGNADIYVACYNDAGAVQWVSQAGGALIDRARGIGTNGSNIYLTGQFGNTATFGTHTLNAADSSDVFIAGLNNSGSWIWAMSVGGAADSLETLGYESGIAVTGDANGYVYATGSVLDGGVFGGTTYNDYAHTDIFVTKIAQLGAGIEENNSGTLSIYPNPGNGDITIDLTNFIDQKNELTVSNCLGQVIEKRNNLPLAPLTMDLRNNEKGIYFIEVRSENTVSRSKVIIQ
jgi:hypothetical protein